MLPTPTMIEERISGTTTIFRALMNRSPKKPNIASRETPNKRGRFIRQPAGDGGQPQRQGDLPMQRPTQGVRAKPRQLFRFTHRGCSRSFPARRHDGRCALQPQRTGSHGTNSNSDRRVRMRRFPFGTGPRHAAEREAVERAERAEREAPHANSFPNLPIGFHARQRPDTPGWELLVNRKLRVVTPGS